MGNILISPGPPFSEGDDPSFGLMFNNHAAIMLLIEPETDIILEANPAALKFYGYPKHKLFGMPVSEINCLTQEQVAIERQKARDEGRIYLVLEQRLANGRVRTVEELSSNIIWKHKPALFLIMHDITERTQPVMHNLDGSIRKELRQSEIILEDLSIHKMELEMQNEELRRIEIELEIARARYFDLYDLAPVGYCTVSFDDVITETNLTAANLLGLTRAAMQKQPFHRYIHPGYQPDYFQSRRQLFENGQHLGLDVEMLKKDGSHFWARLEATSSPVSLANSELEADSPVTARIVICDISERKRTDQVLRENQELVLLQSEEKAKQAARLVIANQELVFQNEEKAKQAAELALVNSYLENLINHANAPIIVWDLQFRITRFNHAFEFLTGRSEAEVLGQSLEILFPPSLVEKTMALIRKTSVGERWESVEIKILNRDASVRTLLWNSATLFEPDGKTALATIAQGQDITERKQAEQALQAANDVLELRVLERTTDLQKSNETLREAHLQLEGIIEGTRAGTWVWNIQTGEAIFNEVWGQMVGYTLAELLPTSFKTLERLAHPDDLKLVYELLDRHFRGELPYYDCEMRMKHRDGHWVWIQDRGQVITRTADNKPLLMFGTHTDISVHKELEASERANTELYHAMFEQNYAVKLLIDPLSGQIVKANQAAASFYGWPGSVLETMNISQINILSPEQLIIEMARVITDRGHVFNFRHRLASGEFRDVEVYSGPIECNGRNLLFSIIHDVTERVAAEEKVQLLNAELEKLSATDYLTKLYNRRYFMQRLTEEFKRENRSNQPLSFLMIDLDEFKKVNDVYGHVVGDLVLQQVAEVLSSNLREVDILGRIGGEEFAALLPNTLLEDAVVLAERMRQSVAEASVDEGDQKLHITVSIGAADWTDEMTSINDLLRNADLAMYQAKASGRNCVRVFQPAPVVRD